MMLRLLLCLIVGTVNLLYAPFLPRKLTAKTHFHKADIWRVLGHSYPYGREDFVLKGAFHAEGTNLYRIIAQPFKELDPQILATKKSIAWQICLSMSLYGLRDRTTLHSDLFNWLSILCAIDALYNIHTWSKLCSKRTVLEQSWIKENPTKIPLWLQDSEYVGDDCYWSKYGYTQQAIGTINKKDFNVDKDVLILESEEINNT